MFEVRPTLVLPLFTLSLAGDMGFIPGVHSLNFGVSSLLLAIACDFCPLGCQLVRPFLSSHYFSFLWASLLWTMSDSLSEKTVSNLVHVLSSSVSG